jgi:regulatory protein
LIKNDNIELDQQGEENLAPQLMDRAYALLSRREHSAHELKQKLARKAPREVCNEVVEQLTRLGDQSDERFAEMLCRSRFNAGKGPIRLQRELQDHQIEEHLAEAAMAEYEDSWSDLAEQVRIRKFGDKSPHSYADWAKQARFLQQRGFAPGQIVNYTGSFQGSSRD